MVLLLGCCRWLCGGGGGSRIVVSIGFSFIRVLVGTIRRQNQVSIEKVPRSLGQDTGEKRSCCCRFILRLRLLRFELLPGLIDIDDRLFFVCISSIISILLKGSILFEHQEYFW